MHDVDDLGRVEDFPGYGLVVVLGGEVAADEDVR